MKRNEPSEEALKAFYKTVEPALIRIAKENREKTKHKDLHYQRTNQSEILFRKNLPD